MKIEQEMKTTNPSFKGFYHELRYFNRFNKCIQKFESIMSQVPLEIRNKIEPDVHMQEIMIEIFGQDDQVESSSQAHNGSENKFNQNIREKKGEGPKNDGKREKIF